MLPPPHDQEETSAGTRVALPGIRRRPLATWTILGVNLVLWLLSEVSGGSTDPDVLIRLGAMEGQRIAAGDYWRLFTAMFLHSGLMHLGLNCVGLFIFGHQLEQMYGHSRFLLIYIVAGLAGSVTSYALSISLSAHTTIGVGASGAIFGVLGALVAFFLSHRHRLGAIGRQNLTGLLILAAINLFLGLVIQGVDNYAHMGGFFAGILMGLALSPDYRPAYNVFGEVEYVVDANSIFRRWWVAPAAALVLLVGTFAGNRNVGESAFHHLRDAVDYRLQEEFALALDELDRAMEIDPDYGPAYLERALVMIEMGNPAMAISDLARARYLGLAERDGELAVRLLVQLGRDR